MRGALVLFLSLLAFPAQSAPSWLAGIWFGQGQPNDKSEMWLARMAPNGDFRVQFRRCRGNKAVDTIETGRWALIGNLETITINTVDGQFSPRQDTYTMLSHTGSKQTYRLDRTGFVYTSSRVSESFKMPDCGLTS
jgi:hypothetical protein